MTFAVIPVVLELPLFFKLWLGEYPDYSVIFSRLVIFSLLLETITNQLIGAFQAANKIKFYQSVSSIILLSLVPLSYLSLKIVLNPIVPYVIYVFISFVYILSLIFVAYKQIGLNLKRYLTKVILKDIVVFIPSFVLTYYFIISLPANYWRIPLTFFLSLILTSFLIWMFGVEEGERVIAKAIVNRFLKKII